MSAQQQKRTTKDNDNNYSSSSNNSNGDKNDLMKGGQLLPWNTVSIKFLKTVNSVQAFLATLHKTHFPTHANFENWNSSTSQLPYFLK